MAAEQLVNLYQDTVGAGGYVSGSGVLTVSAGTGAPSSGPFTVTVLNSAGTAILLLFRVSSIVGGVAFHGAAEGPDANAPAGSIVIGSTLSVAAIANLFNSAGFIQPLTAPISGALSNVNFNTGSGVTTTRVNNSSPVTSITLCQADPSSTFEIAAVAKSPINAAFTITGAFTLHSNTGGSLVGLWLSDGSAINIFFGIQTGGGSLVATVLSNYSGSFSSNAFGTANCQPAGPLMWLRIQETVSARNYYISPDGINFFLVFTESNTAHFTTAEYGFGVDCRAAGLTAVTCYNFTETTP
jgi:hypothetical protein